MSRNRKILVVLGMHRSGTSAITRGLEVLGVDLGNNLMPAAADNNEKGFFEDLEIHALNTQLLSELSTSWDQITPLQLDSATQLALLDSYREQAIELITRKLDECPNFAFKDPQSALLLPFWQAIFRSLEARVNYLICLRNPLSVAASLLKRDGIRPATAHLLWAKYFEAALTGTEGSQRLVVDYDALMEAPTAQLERMAKALELRSPRDNPAGLQAFNEDFLTPSLRHAQFDDEHLANASEALRQLSELYSLLKQCADDTLDIQSQAFSDSCRGLFNSVNELRPLIHEIDGLNQTQASLALEIAELQKQEQTIDSLNLTLSSLAIETEDLKQQLEITDKLRDERDELRTKFAISHAECSNAWKMHDQALNDKHEIVAQQLYNQAQIQALHDEINQLKASKSWRLTRPFRGFRRHLHSPQTLVRALVSESSRAAWKILPVSVDHKQRVKALIFQAASPVLKKTRAYQDWQRMASDLPMPVDCAPGKAQEWVQEPVQHVKKFQGADLTQPPAKLISFYLPQYHAIAENNEWWGEGFTEWTNVKPAQPHYSGHYQPHIPGELGYYDLENIETQRQQVELAKRYGIGGFCFYFYWFDGKRLLENPIKQYLDNPELDLPFCLCWANENWSRRWDGLDSQILIGQNHSPEDDVAFIEYIAQYMTDSRYIRVDGKPLLVVYRPSLLPDPKATTNRWRKWCRDNGLGEIYLAYTQSFEIAPPNKYGCDAAIEFPPNSTNPPLANVELLNTDFAGNVFDWSVYLQRSARYSPSSYPLFRGVCPSWDNTARRKNRGTSFINSSPRGYQEWLFNAVTDTVRQQKNPDERLVFINAWNEWAEGAHLEPDQRHGYGFLEATRMANVRAQLHIQPPKTVVANKTIAVVIHAYYPQVFAEIVGYLNRVENVALKLFISTETGRGKKITELLSNCPHDYCITELKNHGRDVLPFLKVLPQIIAEGHEQLIKVHTKKSTHREDGDIWRKDLYEKLLTERSIELALAQFSSDPNLGIIGPAGHLVPMSFYWGSNAATVEKLACRLGISPRLLKNMNFVAGTMFFATTKALLPLLNLALDDDDFEVEAGQVDGTFAHALERTLSVSTHAAGLTVSCTGTTKTNANYQFAEASL